MRHTLAHAIIHGHEAAFRLQCRFNGTRELLRREHERPGERGRQIRQSFVVSAWNQQHVAGKQRAMIEKRKKLLVLVDHIRGGIPRSDLAKQAAHACVSGNGAGTVVLTRSTQRTIAPFGSTSKALPNFLPQMISSERYE